MPRYANRDAGQTAIAILINAHDYPSTMRLARSDRGRDWRVAFCSGQGGPEFNGERQLVMPALSIALLLSD